MRFTELSFIASMCVALVAGHTRVEGQSNLRWDTWEKSDGGNGHSYAAVVQEVTWFEANEKATALGGWLATLELEGENDFVFSLVEPIPEIWRPGADPTSDLLGPWLGGFQGPTGIEPRDGWLWLAEGNEGNPTPFEDGPTYWKPGEPNNLGGQEDYLVYWGVDGWPTPRWNDVPWDYLPRGFVVEVPERGTIALLAIGALTLLRRKK